MIGTTELTLFDGEYITAPATLTGAQAISIPFTKVNLTDSDFFTVETVSAIGANFVRPVTTPVSLKDLNAISLGTLTGARSANDKIYVTIKLWNKVDYSVSSTRYIQVGETENLIIGFMDGLVITNPTASSISVSGLTNAGAATLNLTPSINTKTYWVVNLATAPAPTPDFVLSPTGTLSASLRYGNSDTDTGASRNFALATNQLTPGQAYNYYFVMTADSDPKSISIMYSGSFTIPNVSLTYSATTLNEAVTNSGTITETITVTLVGDTFTGSNGAYTLSTQYSVTGTVPAGMTLVVTKTSNTVLTISLTGPANAHENADDVTLTIALANAAFTGATASVFTNASQAIVVNFNNA
jgi:hypothetical protein